MGAIKLTNFGGIMPRMSQRLIPDNAAQVASNCRLSTGELVPLNRPKKVAACVRGAKTVYRFSEGDNYLWASFARRLNIVKAPLFGSAKWCLTGNGAPQITTLGSATNDTYYTLGVPKPVTKPSISVSGGNGATINRYYAYTFYTKWGDIELEGAVSPISDIVAGKEDGTWVITGMDDEPQNAGFCTASYSSGVTTLTTTTPHWLRAGDSVALNGVVVDVSSVQSSTVFKVVGDFSFASSWERKNPLPGVFYKRLYRSTGLIGQFQLVAENITGTSYTDTLSDSAIEGDELISSDWDMPPVGLQGLISLPSGSLAGFVGNKIYFSEPNQPHAWPSGYEIQVDYPIVAIASFGSGIAVGTTSAPFIIHGIEPGQMQVQAWDEIYPCVSAGSMVSIGSAAIYASPSGLISVSPVGVSIWSSTFFTNYEFADLNPETMLSAFAEGRLFVNYVKDGRSRTLIFNTIGDTPYLTDTTFDVSAMFVDTITGVLYFAFGTDIYRFDPLDRSALFLDWMSKEIVLPKPANIGAARIEFGRAIDPIEASEIEALRDAIITNNSLLIASGNVRGSWNAKRYNLQDVNGSDIQPAPSVPPSNTVTFHLFTNSPSGNLELRFVKTVRDSKVFRLPSGYKANSVAVRVISQCPIRYIELGGTPSDLATS